MKAKSIKGNSIDEIKSSLKESMVDGFKPTLALIFISANQERETEFHNNTCSIVLLKEKAK